jgi:Di-haem oxidoreductase, putative peroxidase
MLNQIQTTAMLRGGKARNAIEAILWHGGEAEGAREAFRGLIRSGGQALVKRCRSDLEYDGRDCCRSPSRGRHKLSTLQAWQFPDAG